jgi:hypothetical protein
LIAPGTYRLKGKRFNVGNAGSAELPIALVSNSFGDVRLEFDSLEGLYINKPNWIINGIIFKGVCKYQSNCEHAIHIVGNADNLFLSNNRFVDFNAHIKSNGRNGSFPDNVVIINNDFYNLSSRNVKAPVTPIDVVGGNNWLIKDNYIADFAKGNGKKISYAYGAFLKGAGAGGKILNNIVNCSWKLPYSSSLDVRIGLSLGGGGTNARACQTGKCEYEHIDGLIQGNIVLNCENDVGIYLNKASNTQVTENLLLNTLGIDVRFSSSSASVSNNTMQGRISARDGAFLKQRNNRLVPLLESIEEDELFRYINSLH